MLAALLVSPVGSRCCGGPVLALWTACAVAASVHVGVDGAEADDVGCPRSS
ncbi:hypothetical protein PF002_g28496 [Phytophthora fragariae]|uniref:Uncharacterized protein n=1 Tax=Phytophthora fragariae TaxID=53985 RepID=A0A6A3W2A6_9STRA|nr:hypothetical protein PF004_g28347 [Phytophthora fragariae]KAE9176837.1 hypothetical protein PF002_g28496 [Phytophthora fragariae]KAE9269871.1 hypothetical protein PF001_g29039 [Phytophthora fragariae]